MAKLPIINDSTPIQKLYSPEGQQFGRGLDLSLKGTEGYAGVAAPFPASLLIPRSEWQARIQERKERKATLREKIQGAGVQVKNQERTNYCWINAPTFCVEIVRLLQGQKHVVLSPASAGAQIKNYRNVGGWGKEGLEWIIAHGVAPVDLWPANAIDRKYATAETKAAALNYRIDEWWELEPRNIDQLVSCVLRNVPVAVGYNWWSHEVTMVDMDWIDGDIAGVIGNSWGDWGDQGYGILQGSRLKPDDAVAPRTALAA